MASGLGGIFEQLISPTKYPNVPSPAYVDIAGVPKATASANQSAFPELETLGAGVNQFNLGQRNANLAAQMPWLAPAAETGASNIQSWLHGEIPLDVQNQIARSTAGQALAGGYGGSPMAHNLTARDLGLTSLGLQEKATQMLPNYAGGLANILMPQEFNVTSGFVTPGQDIQTQMFNEQNRYRQQWLQNQMDALPDPLMAAVGSFAGDLANTGMMALGAFGGAGLGDGGSVFGAGFGQMAGGGSGPTPAMWGSLFQPGNPASAGGGGLPQWNPFATGPSGLTQWDPMMS